MPYVFNVVSNRHKTESDFLAAYSVPITARASRADVNVEIISLARYSNRSTTKAILFDKFKFVYIVKLGMIDFLPLVMSLSLNLVKSALWESMYSSTLVT